MRPALNGSAKPITHGVAHTGDCHCPTCGSAVSPEVYAAIVGEQAARDAEIERTVEARFAAREGTIRREATLAANAALAPKLAEAAAAKKAADQAVKAAKAESAAVLKQRLDAQAEKAAQERDRAVSTVTEKFFGENLRLQERVLELQRMLEKKQPQERGDDGEIDMIEALLAEFPQDQIARVPKGVNGADIAFRVFANRAHIGTIAVECKSVRRFSHGWIAKLKQDTLDMDASHGVLVTAAFPPGEHQLFVMDGMVVVSPARAIAILHILRRAVIQFHALRLSNQERDEKTARLYDLMVSDRAADRWDRMSSATTELLDIEKADAAHQERTRKKRTGLIHAVQAVHDEFTGDIDCIVRGEPEDLL